MGVISRRGVWISTGDRSVEQRVGVSSFREQWGCIGRGGEDLWLVEMSGFAKGGSGVHCWA